MSKAVMYAANSANQTVLSGGVINFGSLVRKYGCNCNVSGGNGEVVGQGYYLIDTNITVTAVDAGATTISLYKDGVAIPGAEAGLLFTQGGTYAITIPAVIRQNCCCTSTITVVLTGSTGTVNNAAILIEKL